MSIFPADSALFAPLFSDGRINAIFSDQAFVQRLAQVEVALARAQGRLGVIPAEAAQQIAQGLNPEQLDTVLLRKRTEQAGVPVAELVRQLRQQLQVAGYATAAEYLHWGATTQDIIDTALVLQLRAALEILESGLERVITGLVALADRHRTTLMPGRTHSQQALPVTFGLKAAVWLAPLLRQRERLQQLRPRLLVVQFGGAVGTGAFLGKQGPAVASELALELGLHEPLLPWHTQRDSLAEFAGWLSLLSGSLAKMAQDVILLAQSEIAEVRESSDPQRGGSSTMPQKSNPVQSELIIAAARANASLLASMHQALIQEHERATHAWQLEWLTLPQMVALSASALAKAAWLSENLRVDAARMQENVNASRGLMLAEAAAAALSPVLGRAAAAEAAADAARTAVAAKRRLTDVLRERPELAPALAGMSDEADYLGATDELIDTVLAAAAQRAAPLPDLAVAASRTTPVEVPDKEEGKE